MKHVIQRTSIQMWLTGAVALVALMAVACGTAGDTTTAPKTTKATTQTAAPAAPEAPKAPVAPEAAAAPKAPAAAASAAAVATPTPSGAAAPAKPTGLKPKYGGVLRSWVRREPSTYDSIEGGGGVDGNTREATVFERLLEPDKETYTLPVTSGLAESWSVSSDGLQYTFKLRKVKMHNGEDFTSEDVKFWYDRILDPPEGVRVSGGGMLRPLIKSISTPDTQTVVFDLFKVDVEFPIAIVAWPSRMIVPKFLYTEHDGPFPTKERWVGTGPFMFADWRRESLWAVERNPNYWNPELPYLDRIEWANGRDQATMFAAFRTGRIDISSRGGGMGLNTEQVKAVNKMPEASVSLRMVGSHYPYGGNVQEKPWTDIRVRKAVDLAIDRRFICEVSVGEELCGDPAYGYWTQLSNAYGIQADEYWNTLPGYRFPKPQEDIDEAKRLMKEAGYENGFETNTLVRDSALRQIEPLAFDLESKLGIKLKIDLVDTIAYVERDRNNDYNSQYSPAPAPSQSLFGHFGGLVCEGALTTRGNVCDKELDAKVLKMNTILDAAERTKHVRSILDYLYEKSYHALTIYLVRPVAWWDHVVGFLPPIGAQHNNLKFEDVWLNR